MTEPARSATTVGPAHADVAKPIRAEPRSDRLHVLVLAGELDIAVDADLQARLREAHAGPEAVLAVDLSRVTFIDASCADRLLSAAARTRMVLVGASGIVARVLDILDPDERLPRVSTIQDVAATGGS